MQFVNTIATGLNTYMTDFYIVYKTVHVPTGRFYIGRHVATKLNDGYLGSGTVLKRMLKVYPREEFVREVLHLADTPEEMCRTEEARINEMLNHPLCMNCITGDPSTTGAIRHSDAAKKRMSIAKQSMSPEAKFEVSKRISAYRKAYKMPEALKLQISNKLKGKPISEKALENRQASYTRERRDSISVKYKGEGNPRALGWIIHYSDGRASVQIKALKTWCVSQGIKYTSLFATQWAEKSYNNMKVTRV